MVVWFIGLSGSGKTTLGLALKKYLDSKKKKCFILDGDIVRNFYDNDLGYTKKERIENIKRIMLSAYVLEQNGIIPIVCNIAPYQELRDFAAEKFSEYKEIYLKRDLKDITNKQDVYSQDNVIGQDMKFETPVNPFLVINTSSLSIQDSLHLLISELEIENEI